MIMSFKRFAGLQFLAILVWATVVGSVGYLFGETLEKILGDIRRYEKSIVVLVLDWQWPMYFSASFVADSERTGT